LSFPRAKARRQTGGRPRGWQRRRACPLPRCRMRGSQAHRNSGERHMSSGAIGPSRADRVGPQSCGSTSRRSETHRSVAWPLVELLCGYHCTTLRRPRLLPIRHA
jgi:hypothetical protein